jgi:hypothetical protein
VQLQRLIKKHHRDAVAISESDMVIGGTPLSETSRVPPVPRLYREGRLGFKNVQIRRPDYPVTTNRRTDSKFSPVRHSAPRRSSLSEPSLIPPFFASRCLDMYMNSGGWMPNPNASTKRPATDRNVINQKLRTLVPTMTVTLVFSLKNQKLYSSYYFRPCCRSSR